jgi:methylenetetrahydrofolate reductase (NADPH)
MIAMQPQRISEIYAPGRFELSIEIFPPKTPDGDEGLFQTLERLAVFKPAFISCTYGAGGSTRLRTIELCRAIQTDLRLTATAHFTCVGSTREQLMDWLTEAWQAGIRNIMALRGDPPAGQQAFQSVDGGFSHANELVALIRGQFKEMGIGVAGYPEKHPEAPSLQADIENLKRKVGAGADAIYWRSASKRSRTTSRRSSSSALSMRLPSAPNLRGKGFPASIFMC